ncbi:5' nucleotidase, NT5C type [Croceiramulus getboli]|nr:5'(3')-deoxyribonucleotidase [Flavobacteriaceae bacterium YJPT1-3]
MTIFVDMDEVLADTYGAHIKHYNEEYGAQLTREECMGKDVWECVPKERQKSVHAHTSKEGFFRNLEVIEDSQEVLKELSNKYDIYIASAAMEYKNSLIEKYDWLDAHFPFIGWRKRILCGHKHILKGDLLIDDRSFNLERFSGRVLQFTSPHNVNTISFERVDNWKEVADKLL